MIHANKNKIAAGFVLILMCLVVCLAAPFYGFASEGDEKTPAVAQNEPSLSDTQTSAQPVSQNSDNNTQTSSYDTTQPLTETSEQPDAALMPDITGKNYAEALTMLKEAGVENLAIVTYRYENGKDLPFGMFGVLNSRNWTVHSQSIQPNTPVDSYETLVLSLSRSGIGIEGMTMDDFMDAFFKLF